jgi:hypothetical protein
VFLRTSTPQVIKIITFGYFIIVFVPVAQAYQTQCLNRGDCSRGHHMAGENHNGLLLAY